MKHFKIISLFLTGFPILLTGCMNLKQPVNKIDHYTLESVPPKISGLKPLSHVIKLERFTTSPTYNTRRIIYRDRSFKRDSYVYCRWRANPGALVTHILNRDIRFSRLFKATLTADSRFISSYMLEGTVDEFFEWDMEETWKAVLSLSITLMDEKEIEAGEKILFQKTYREEAPCKQKNPRALAEAMSCAMSEISEHIIKDIYDCLKDRDPYTPG
ncbi:MAG: ABC-type transport auxiliary lipoprotein family protein [Desulfobacterales bacterium]